MKKSVDVLVIGGSAAGIAAATTGKAFYADKSFMIVRKEQEAVVPCGIPYIFGTLTGVEQNVIPNAHIEGAGVELVIDEVVSLDRESKTARTANGLEISFDKVVIATGSQPRVPGWLKGCDLQNVFTIPKDRNYLADVHQKLQSCEKIVIIGGGFIGVEMADELIKKASRSPWSKFSPMCSASLSIAIFLLRLKGFSKSAELPSEPMKKFSPLRVTAVPSSASCSKAAIAFRPMRSFLQWDTLPMLSLLKSPA